jgi:predicted CoA-substrate-specific enzyme activase
MSLSDTEKHFLGIDIGSVSFSYVLTDQNKQILKSDYIFHQGNIFKLLREKLEDIDLSRTHQVAYNYKSSDFFASGVSINEQIALIEGALFQEKNIGSIFVIGGETFGLFLFDGENRYRKYISSSSCAAGTGAFLDQQADRLGLSGSEELSRLAESFNGEPPKIASRCAVFAKTDLIHCQQQGYSLEAICAGFCKGLAHNIADTLIKGVTLREPVMAVGGVSKNPKVIRYLSEMIGHPIVIPSFSTITGAIGCSLNARSRPPDPARRFSIETLLKKQDQTKQYFFAPLISKLSTFPDFSEHTRYVLHDVEVDLYNPPRQKGRIPVYLGIDIGSTSTKAVVTDTGQKGQILFGLYTRTTGRPIKATQNLLRVLREIEEQNEIHFEFHGVGTTGSGRKFIQKVINADMAVDEITAHAKAAYALNPQVDTVIEIGGQDAKFTVMKNGRVTFSVMNYVCAAGTGSFIEEQAKRLGVPLDEYAERAMGTPSPLTSDRCTVFMERDLNHYLAQGYSKEELLAAALHSVRDNYLSKVAHPGKIGEVICFQGATAKNEALVTAFEQKLEKPIFVSKYCHLTGALGVCLILKEKHVQETRFRGISFYRETPDVSEEVCDLCKNHCKLKRIRIANESIMWGFLCGRDDSGATRKPNNRSQFDLLSNRRRIFTHTETRGEDDALSAKTSKSRIEESNRLDFDFSYEKLKESLELNVLNLRHKLFAIGHEEIRGIGGEKGTTIGIPNALYMLEFLPFWKLFYQRLGYRVYISPSKAELMERGKEIAGAEFCAPMSYWHGHVFWLSQRPDYLFLPQMLEGGETGEPKFYCYYSGYAVALLLNIKALDLEHKCISPLIDFSKTAIYNVQQIYESLPRKLKFIQTPGEIQEAYTQAWRWYISRKQLLVEIFRQQRNRSADISVVFLGRPYVIMDPVLNKNIPQKFNEYGIKTFFQDMLPQIDIGPDSPGKEFIDWNHWKYGANILQAVEFIGQSPGLYPVYLSAFKCSPDSFVLDYFKEIMDAYQKPYLILQIDEHGSDIGYETRVESAMETFRNHFQQNISIPRTRSQNRVSRLPLERQTILLPNYDPLSCSLICAAFEHGGYRTRLIEETPMTVMSSLRLNDGQCLPLCSVVQGAVETIQKYRLKPENTALYLNAITRTACNLPQYPLMAKKLLQQRGDGFEKVRVFAGEFEMKGLPLELIHDVYCSYLLGGLIRKIGCRQRPYETIPARTNLLIEDARQRLYRCIAAGGAKETAFREVVADFARNPLGEQTGTRPKVAIIGDLYVRDNDAFNQELITDLENYGAEVVTVPFNYVLRLLLDRDGRYLWEDGRYISSLGNRLLAEVLEKFERRFYQVAGDILHEDFPTFEASTFDSLKKYNVSLRHGGETAQNILKIFSLLRHYPDLTLLIHVNPIFCCPALVSESLFKAVEKDIGIPIVSIVYDGTTTKKNEILAPYLHYISRSFTERK